MSLVEQVPRKLVRIAEPSTSSDIAAFKASLTFVTMIDALKDPFNTLQAYFSSSTTTSRIYNKHSPKHAKTDHGPDQVSSPYTAAPHKITLQNEDYIAWTIGPKSVCIICSCGPYDYRSHQWNKSACYSTAAKFLLFVAGDAGKSSIVYNNTNWHWCEKCERMSSHATANHKQCSNPRKPKHDNKSDDGLPPLGAYQSKISCITPPSDMGTTLPEVFDADADEHSLLQPPAPSDDES